MASRPNRATVKDEGLGTAFTQGVNEGFRLVGYVRLICKVGDRERVNEVIQASDVPDALDAFVGGLRGEHYEIGISIRILAESDVAPESGTAEVTQEEIGETGIEDAEIVDE